MDRPVLVFQGQAWEAASLQSKLEDAGIEVCAIYLPNVEGHELFVHPDRAAEAQRIATAEGRRATGALADLGEEQDPHGEHIRLLGRRIAPLTKFIVTAPAAFAIGAVYVARAGPRQRRTGEHREFVLAWTASTVLTVLILACVLLWIRA